MEHAVKCICENEMTINFPDQISTKDDPDLLSKIEKGDFQKFICDSCGKELKLELPVRIIDKANKIDVFFIPKEEAKDYVTGKTGYRPVGRAVIGYPELIEKIRVLTAKLDDKAIELIKYYLLQKADADENISIYFHNIDSDKIVFHIHGMKEEEVGVIPVPLKVYKDTQKQVKEKEKEPPFSLILSEPYISVNNLIYRSTLL
ncbi:MAG: CpXC domain-containing protein [Spirochaetia bacterium]